MLYSARIGSGIATEAARNLQRRGWRTAHALAGSSWEERVQALNQAGVLIGLSVPQAFSVDDISPMTDDAIVLALANPEPEVDPDAARSAGAAVVCTGRSDVPNPVSNVLGFPGLSRGALDERVVPAVAAAVAGPR